MREAVVAAIAAQRALLLERLASAGAQDWERPTACERWTVKDVLGHLVEGELVDGRFYRREIDTIGYLDADEGIARWRPLPGDAVRSALWQHGTATQRVLEALDDAAWRAPITAFGCSRIGQLARLHLFELAVHGHDLTDGLGVAPAWAPALPIVAGFVVRAAPRTFGRLGAPPPGSVRIRTGSGRWTLRAGEGGRWSVAEDADAETDADVQLTDEALVLTTTGRASLQEGLKDASIAGDAALARAVFERWQIVASPPNER
ncbi:MAG TPA: maleylpyruvate isomerase family mycothiol-dependent enzyme [Actinomycetota bacterium]